jgi:CelD/BcsL family acetyltransferase involved in cellulose biosynthesis
MNFRIIKEDYELASLSDVWDPLYIRSASYTPFCTLGWIRTWWKFFGGDRKIFVVVASHDGETVGIAPLMLSKHTRFAKRLEFMVDDNGSRFDFAVAEGFRKQFFEGLSQILLKNRSLWDECLLNYFPCGSDNFLVIRHSLDPAQFWVGEHFFQSPYIILDETWEGFLNGRKSKLRSNINRLMRKSAEAGFVCRMVSRDEDPKKIENAVWEVEKNSWKHHAGTGLDASKITKDFYSRIFSQASEDGNLYMALMEHEKRPVAYDFNWAAGDTVFSLKMGFDERYRNISPGKMLFAYTIKKSIEDGFRYHELMGVNEDFKNEWTDKSKTHSRFHVYHKGVTSKLFRFANFRAKPVLKKMLRKAR